MYQCYKNDLHTACFFESVELSLCTNVRQHYYNITAYISSLKHREGSFTHCSMYLKGQYQYFIENWQQQKRIISI